ncbi:MAG: hypothetical protein GYB20_02595 [Oceanospirillales bacterium]|nr:hypothetical protein [Oceanospirillales bacterium]MBR9886580.1 hypothetical protein [Oceanospirillales bacterium]
MIIYHPAYDAHHCSYRILNILSSVEEKKLEKDSLKLIDYYYLYPHLLKRVSKLPRTFNKYKNEINDVPEPFELTPNPKSLYFELVATHDSVLISLSQKSLITLSDNEIVLNIALLPKSLIETFNADEFSKSDFFIMLTTCFPKISLNGPNGFKSRSGLMEYRYG